MPRRAEYLRLGSTSDVRRQAYRDLFKAYRIEEELYLLRKVAHYCQPIGNDRFRQRIVRNTASSSA